MFDEWGSTNVPFIVTEADGVGLLEYDVLSVLIEIVEEYCWVVCKCDGSNTVLWTLSVAFSDSVDDACKGDELNDEYDSRDIVDSDDINGGVDSVDSFICIDVNDDVVFGTDIDDFGIEGRCDDRDINWICNDRAAIEEGDDNCDGDGGCSVKIDSSVVEAVDKHPWKEKANQVEKIIR